MNGRHWQYLFASCCRGIGVDAGQKGAASRERVITFNRWIERQRNIARLRTEGQYGAADPPAETIHL